MAQVTGMTAEEIEEQLSDVVVGAQVIDGFLMVTTRDGTVINAGGVSGEDGNAWYSGVGAPAPLAYSIGDFYLNEVNGDYYTKTGPSTWELQGTLKGPQGDQGIQGIQGEVGPEGPEGVVYVDPEPPPTERPEGHMWYDEDDETVEPFSWNELADRPTLNYLHDQPVASATWNVTHNLGFFPNVTVVDSAGNVVMGDVRHLNAFAVTITFGAEFGGQAFLS